MKLKTFIFKKFKPIKEDKESIFEDEIHKHVRRTVKADSLLSKVCIFRLGSATN